MNLNQLRYFETIAEHEHFTAAANALFISQPSLTNAIHSLEKELGTQLFEKSGRNVKLTADGILFQHYVTKALKELDKGIEKVRNNSPSLSSTINIACIPPLVKLFLPTLIGNYSKESQDPTGFTIRQATTLSIVKGIKSGEFTIGLCRYVKDAELVIHPIIKQNFVVIVPIDHPFAKKESIELHELMNTPIIGYHQDVSIQNIIGQLFSENQLQLKPVLLADCELSVASLVEKGLGLGIVTDSPSLHHFRIKKLYFLKDAALNDLNLVYLRNKEQDPTTQSFIRYIEGNGQTLFDSLL